MGIRVKFIVYIILPILIAIGGASFYTTTKEVDSIETAAQRKFMLDTDLAAEKISAEAVRGISAAKGAATSAEVLFGNRASTIKMLKQMLAYFPTFSSANIAYAINADYSDHRAELGLKNIRDGKDVYAEGALDSYDFTSNKTTASIDEWIAASEGGRFVATWNRVDGDLVLLPFYETEYDFHSVPLRKRVDLAEKDLSIVSEPYVASDKNKTLVEYAAAIMSDGRYSGYVSFVSDTARIQAVLTAMRAAEDEDYFVVSPQDKVIASSRFENLRPIPAADLYVDNAGNPVRGIFKENGGAFLRDDSALAKTDMSKYDNFYGRAIEYVVSLARNTADLSDKKMAVYTDKKTGRRYYADFAVSRASKWIVVHLRPESGFFELAGRPILGDIASLAVLLAATLAGLFALTSMTARMSVCRRALERFSRGDLTPFNPSGRADDEVGRLSLAASEAVSEGAKFAAALKTSRDEIGAVLKSINDALDAYVFRSNSIGTRIAKISASLNASIRRGRDGGAVAEKIGDGVDAALGTGENARKEFSHIDDLVDMFARNAAATRRRNSGIVERMKAVSDISADIAHIADESNLLSLNASIEAEKSGKYGSSFAVIAREINRISESVSGASIAMKTLVQDMETAVSGDSAESDRLLENIGEFSAKYSKILGEMDAVVEQMKTASPAARSLARSCGENMDGFAHALDMLGEVAESVDKLNASRAELTAAAESLSEQLRKMRRGRSDTL